MKYFKLLYDYEHDEDAVVCSLFDLQGITQNDIEKGMLIEGDDYKITFTYDPSEGNRTTDYIGNDMGWLIISEHFKNLLQNLIQDRVQYLPVTIKNKNTDKKIGEYFVANIYNIVAAIDLKNSKYDTFEVDESEKVISIERYALKSEAIKDNDIFKLSEENIPIFVSEKIVNVVREKGLTGCDFLEVKVV